MTVSTDWKWSDKFIPAIRSIVGPYLLEPAILDIDRHEATDLMILKARDLQIACRVRRRTSNPNYIHQFTVRSNRKSGAKTEFNKIVEGHGDWMLYAFAADDTSSELAHWSLIDLHAFRAHLILNSHVIRTGEQTLPEGTSFRWFDLRSFPNDPPILIATYSDRIQEGTGQ